MVTPCDRTLSPDRSEPSAEGHGPIRPNVQVPCRSCRTHLRVRGYCFGVSGIGVGTQPGIIVSRWDVTVNARHSTGF